MNEVTHQYDDTGRYMQVVTPEELRRILDEQGSDYSPPDHFGPDDEWDVGEDEVRAHDRAQSRLATQGAHLPSILVAA